MPRRRIPQVIDDQLTRLDAVGGSLPPVSVGSAAWSAWLADAATRSFAFQSSAGSFTARREQRHDRWYWYAYRTQDRQLRKAYLGTPEEVTPERLHAAAAQLAAAGLRVAPDDPMSMPLDAQLGAPAAGYPAEPPAPDQPAHIIATKLYLPQARPELVPRPRLLARLDAGLGATLTLISAPAGFGKTTLLATWLGPNDERGTMNDDGSEALIHPSSFIAHRFRVAWLSLDAVDNDPNTFLRYLVAAVQTVAPTVGATTRALLRALQPPPIEALLISLINDLAALPQAILLVLDDYHSITTPAIHRALQFLLDHLPSTLHLVIATREDPPLPLARLRARGRLSELRAADLRFTPQEAGAFLTEVMHLPLDADTVAALEARTEGWIAGLQLAALAMQNRADHAGFVAAFTGSNRFVVDYLLEEVLNRLPAHLQTFVLQTAILDRMCGPLCDAVLGLTLNDERSLRRGATSDTDSSFIAHRSSFGDSYSQLLLAELERANLFLVPLDDERRWYRYHHLFAEVLRVRLRRGAAAGEVATLHQHASAWFEQAELIGEAVRYAFLAYDVERAASLIERHAMGLIFRRSEVLLVRTWLEQLPGALAVERPRLALIHGWMLALTGQPDAVEQLLANAATALSAPDLPADVVGELAALRSTVARLLGDSAGTLALAQRALDLLLADQQALRAGAALNSGVAYLQRGDTAAAHQALAEASTLAAADGSQWIALAALEELASLQFRQGQLTQVLHTCEQAVQLATRYGGRPIPVAGMAHIGIGEVLCEWDDLDGATHALAHGIELLRGATEQMLLARGYAALARVQQARGDGESALATIQRGEDWFAQIQLSGPLARAWLAAQRARLWIQQGDLIAAGRWVRACTFTGHSELDYMQQLTLVRLRLAQSHQDTSGPFLGEASSILAELLPAVEARGWARYLIEILVLQALVCRAQASQTGALAAIERALTLAEPERYARTFVDVGVPMQELLLTLRRHPPARSFAAYIDRLLAAFGELRIENEELRKTPTSDSQFSILNSQFLEEPLTDRELEVLRLIAGGASNSEIANRLVVAVSTVKKHVNNLFGKLDVQSRTQALVRARELNLL